MSEITSNKTLQFANILAAKQHYQKEQISLQQKRCALEKMIGSSSLNQLAQLVGVGKWKKVIQLANSKAKKIAVARKIYNKERFIVESVDSTGYFSELWICTLIMLQSVQKADCAIDELASKISMDNAKTVALSACILSNALFDQTLANGLTLRESIKKVCNEPLFERGKCAQVQTALFKMLLAYQMAGGDNATLDVNAIPKDDIADLLGCISVLFAETLDTSYLDAVFSIDILRAMYLTFNRNARKTWQFDSVFASIKDLEQYAVVASIYLFGVPCLDGELLYQFEETAQISDFTNRILQCNF